MFWSALKCATIKRLREVGAGSQRCDVSFPCISFFLFFFFFGFVVFESDWDVIVVGSEQIRLVRIAVVITSYLTPPLLFG